MRIPRTEIPLGVGLGDELLAIKSLKSGNKVASICNATFSNGK